MDGEKSRKITAVYKLLKDDQCQVVDGKPRSPHEDVVESGGVASSAVRTGSAVAQTVLHAGDVPGAIRMCERIAGRL